LIRYEVVGFASSVKHHLDIDSLRH
jgi:hypothetical protein